MLSTNTISRLSRAWPLAACLFASACAVDDVTRAEPPSAPVASTLVGAAEDLGAGVPPAASGGAGHVVGAIQAADGGTAAFLWSPGEGPRRLARLDSAAAAADTAYALNGAGQIAGVSAGAGGVRRAVLWAGAGAAPEALGELRAGGWSAAHDVNASGTVVGAAESAGGAGQAFVWTRGGGMVALGSAPGAALAVNDSGTVVGWTGAPRRAFVWTAAGGLRLLRGDGATATDVSEQGVVVGSVTTGAGDERAVAWYPPFGPLALGTLGGTRSVALGINDAGMVVGLGTTSSGETHAFAWSLRSGMRDLGTLGGPASAARAINAAGQVAGHAAAGDGEAHGVRWTVTEHNSAPTAALAHAGTLYGTERQALRIASASSDAEGDPLAHLWSFGDGMTAPVFFTTGDAAVIKRYSEEGTYPLGLIVIDPSGARDTVAGTVVITNAAPTGVFVLPSRAAEGSAYRLSAASVVDAPSDLAAGVEAAFDCGDGALTPWSRTLSVPCPARPDDGTPSVRMRLRDRDGGVSEAGRTLEVLNAMPLVSVGAPGGATVRVGAPVEIAIVIRDPGVLDGPWSYRIGWADRRADTGVASDQSAPVPATHVYTAAGTYTAIVDVTDRQGRTGRGKIVITVQP